MQKEEYNALVYNQDALGIDDKEIYSTFFKQIIPKIEENRGIKVLFGNQDGSRARGMSNQSSDIDMHFFGETENLEITYELMCEEGQIADRTIVYDLAPHCLKRTLENVTAYGDVIRKYPTVFYRTDEEKKKYSPENIHWNIRYREDGEIFEFIQFLIADTIFINRQEKEKVDMNYFYRLVKTVDMLDLQFVRAYGNYNNLMIGKEEVLVRKYLYTLYEIFFCRWMIEYGTRPPMVLEELIRGGQELNKDVRQSVHRLMEVNRTSTGHKTKLKCCVDVVLNDYIGEMLEQLQDKIASYDREERYASIIERTEPERRQKIIFY